MVRQAAGLAGQAKNRPRSYENGVRQPGLVSKKIPLTVPGPSPWYLRAPSASFETARGRWTWHFPERPGLAGVSCLLTPESKPVLLLDFGCYVLPLANERVLVWYESGRESEPAVAPARITMIMLQLDDLQPYPDSDTAAEEMRASRRRAAFRGGTSIVFEVSTDVRKGTHPMSPPPSFRELGEILVLADFGPVASNHLDKMARAIFALDFQAGRLSVLPQRWFNNGKYDFSYQWITRVQREEATGYIVGEGVRLGNFRLDRSGTRIREWLHEDAFYHPAREL